MAQIMQPKKYFKKRIAIEAIQFTGNNFQAIRDFCGSAIQFHPDNSLKLNTLEGEHHGRQGVWIAKGNKGEFYFIQPDIFTATYSSEEEAQIDSESWLHAYAGATEKKLEQLQSVSVSILAAISFLDEGKIQTINERQMLDACNALRKMLVQQKAL